MNYQKLETNIVAVQIELTNICPLQNCAECAWRYMIRPIGKMDLDFAKMVILGAVEAFGPQINFNLNGLGEPLSYSYLADIIHYIGIVAPKGRVELFTSLIGPLERIKEVCQTLLDIKNNVLLATTCHIRDDNGNILEKTANHFAFSTVYNLLGNIPRIDLHVATNVSIYTTDKDIKIFNDIFLPVLGKDKVHVIERLDPWLELIRPYAKECSDVINPAVCDYLFKVLHITWDGKILLCCTDDVTCELIIGEIKEKKDIKEIWLSPAMELLRERHNNLDVKDLSPCNKCSRTKGYIAH